MAQALRSRLESIDVSDPRLYQDDTWRPLFAKLRRDDPVHYCETSPCGSYWSVTRYDDIFAIELDGLRARWYTSRRPAQGRGTS